MAKLLLMFMEDIANQRCHCGNVVSVVMQYGYVTLHYLITSVEKSFSLLKHLWKMETISANTPGARI